MKRFTLTHLLLFVTWCGIGCVVLSQYLTTMPYTGSTNDIHGATFYDYSDGQQFSSTLDEERVRASTPWNPRNANPPVSAREALAIADKLRRTRLRDVNNWTWKLESLTLYPLDGANNKWCWHVTFEAHVVQGMLSGTAPSFSAFVLMDGTVIPPEPEPYDSQFGIVSEKEAESYKEEK